MARDTSVILEDMLEAIDGILNATKDMELDAFASDWVVKHAVQRGVEIVSEASRHLPLDVKAHGGEVPWPKVQSIGNILRHEYHRISDRIVWNLVRDELPSLRAVLQRLLDAERQRD